MHSFKVGDWLVQSDLNRLSRGEEEVSIEPRAMELLAYLARHAGTLLPKERILKTVWDGAFVGDEALTVAIAQVRRALGDDARSPTYIQTIPRRGYVLIADVSVPEGEASRYEILEKLGQGAMGEVYLALDRVLRRKVALKFIREDKQQDARYRKRLLGEARAAAALDHPFICKTYTVGRLEERDFISQEYLPGRTLKETLEAGPLPVDRVSGIALEMAEALAEAHRQGIIHRDLKPSNVMLGESGHVKIMDFGLARRLPDLSGGDETETTPSLDQDELSPGTLAYMSPEQLRGETPDKRSDLFSLGMLLYEMLSGRPPFRRGPNIATISSILSEHPTPLIEIVQEVPVALASITARLLDKKIEARYQSAAEVVTDLQALSARRPTGGGSEVDSLPESGPETPAGEGLKGEQPEIGSRASKVPSPVTRSLPIGLFFAVILLAIAGIWALWPTPAGPTSQPIRMTVLAPPGETFLERRQAISLSPDGRTLAFTAGQPGQVQTREARLYLRPLDRFEATPVPGSERTEGFCFSPGGEWVAFCSGQGEQTTRFAVGILKKYRVAEEAGAAVPIYKSISDAEVIEADCPCYWGADDRILFTQGWIGGLSRVPASGGEVTVVTELAQGESNHRRPQVLPGGHLLYTVNFQDLGRQPEIRLRSADGTTRPLVKGAGGHFVDGYLLFAVDQTLWAAPFDLHTLELSGERVPLAEDLKTHTVLAGTSAHYGAAAGGFLAYVPPEDDALSHPILEVDRSGKIRRTLVEAPWPTESYWALSPEGERLVFVIEGDIWIYDLNRKNWRQLTVNSNYDVWAIWDPDGERLVARKVDDNGVVFDLVPLSDPESPEEIFRFETLIWHQAVARDGTLIFTKQDSNGVNADIWTIGVDGHGDAQPLIQTQEFTWALGLSNDEKWLVYYSNEAGPLELFVASYPSGTRRARITYSGDSGVRSANWSRNRRELFYFVGDDLWSLPVLRTEPSFRVGEPQRLFEWSYGPGRLFHGVQVSPDGEGFLTTPRPIDSNEIRVVLGWNRQMSDR